MEEIKLAQPTYYSDTAAFRLTLQPYDGRTLRPTVS